MLRAKKVTVRACQSAFRTNFYSPHPIPVSPLDHRPRLSPADAAVRASTAWVPSGPALTLRRSSDTTSVSSSDGEAFPIEADQDMKETGQDAAPAPVEVKPVARAPARHKVFIASFSASLLSLVNF